jgi:hypothetical protein
VGQLYPQALGSNYVAPYNSQGYGGGILTLPNLEGKVPVYVYPTGSVSQSVQSQKLKSHYDRWSVN